MTIRLARISLALCGVLLATACVRMPSEGPVTEVDTEPSSNAAPGISTTPRRRRTARRRPRSSPTSSRR